MTPGPGSGGSCPRRSRRRRWPSPTGKARRGGAGPSSWWPSPGLAGADLGGEPGDRRGHPAGAALVIIGVGTDLVSVPRLRRAVGRRDRLLTRLFTEAEVAECRRRADPAPHLAARFAAKEACLKALQIGWGGGGRRGGVGGAGGGG